MRVAPLPPGNIGAEITQLKLRSAQQAEVALIKQALYAHKLVIFRGQQLSPVEYIEFARKLGRPQVYFQHNYHHPEHPEIFVSSNILEEGKKVGVASTGRYWHTDYQFFHEPLPLVMVSPQVLPTAKRETYFIDMQRVYEALPADLRSYVDGRRAIQEGKWRYKITPEDVDKALTDILAAVEKLVPAITHPAVIEHPLTGRKSLYVSSGFTTGLQGLSHEENRDVMARLFAFIEREEHVQTHAYQPGDILLWENRALLHKASDNPLKEPSKSYRIGIYDELPFYRS
jgi:taurine dioxygenase